VKGKWGKEGGGEGDFESYCRKEEESTLQKKGRVEGEIIKAKRRKRKEP